MIMGSLAAGAAARLKCGADGTFTLLMISDLHYRPERDERGIALNAQLIAREKPGLVIVAGDCLSGTGFRRAAEVESAVAQVAEAMEKARVPWAITFGNHDLEHFKQTGATKEQVMRLYESYPCNVNAGWVQGIHGVGNKCILLWNAAGTRPVLAVWLIDSGDQPLNRVEDKYDWIHADQVNWYVEESKRLESAHGGKIPGLMFFHIPLPEFAAMAAAGKFTGKRKENECPSTVNGGMFAAVLERGDVKGIFCGHDHVNTYVGNWRGVMLGYDGVAGYRCYPKMQPEDPAHGAVRGGRVFRINEADGGRFRTWMRFQNGSTEGEAPAE